VTVDRAATTWQRQGTSRPFECRSTKDVCPTSEINGTRHRSWWSNRALVARFFPGEQAIGRVAEVFGDKRTIVGVVGDVKDTPSDVAALPAYWFPYQQVSFGAMTLVIKTNADHQHR
jgi:hypothetical protein